MQRCPSCRAHFKGEATCYRCGADLSSLLSVEVQAKQWRKKAVLSYQTGDYSTSQQYLRRAKHLDSNPAAGAFADFLTIKLKEPVVIMLGEHADSANSKLAQSIIDSAKQVKNIIGNGLTLGAYEDCLCRELSMRQISFKRNYPVPVVYKGLRLRDCATLNLLVENEVAVLLCPAGESIVQFKEHSENWIRLGGWMVGIIIGFDVRQELNRKEQC